MEEKVGSMELSPHPEHLCYVRCNYCNTVLAVVIPCKRLLETVTVKCGHCGNVSFLSNRPPLQVQGQCLDHQLSLHQGFNFMEKAGGGFHSNGTNYSDAQHKKGQSSSSTTSSYSSPSSTDPVSPPPFVVKPPEKKHRLPSAYNRFMKEEIQRIKAANPEIPHREAFSSAAKNWARFLPESPAGSLGAPESRNNH